MVKINYQILTLSGLIQILLRAERLIALIESPVQIMESFDEETLKIMLENAYIKKREVEAELANREAKQNLDRFLRERNRQIMYAGSIEELRQKGMQAPISREPKLPAQ